MEPQQTALMAYLKTKSVEYYAKVLELRSSITGWLSYIPETFPHYTSHTVDHSDEIVLQVSKLLFKDDNPDDSAVPLSGAEAYILCVASYLHDAGMVVSDREKTEILKSSEWKNWTTSNGGGAKRWELIQQLRHEQLIIDESVRNFIADVQTRFLIAEFIRARHHLRAVDILSQHQSTLGRFAFDDPTLLRTIADVCIAHGLRQYELEDRERYPDRRDILGDKVNVRFVAILLRLGDLLDMRYDRACPLLLNAACPLPPESLAHWTQYGRISHRMVAPDRIEITADCLTQEEHRYLQDWCQWLVEEARNASVVVSRTMRHNHWTSPTVTLEGDSPTIKIRPAKGVTYIPSRWTFQLDPDAIFERLVRDVYDHPLAFVRELIQNALDAMRCQMYLDLRNDGLEEPEYPTRVEEERRRRYVLKINLQYNDVKNALSGETEKRQVLTIDDCGMGMDREIIERYLLQVGRSFYVTDDFRRNFRFSATSRFGLGFLSVFAVSDRVIVETYKPSSSNRDGPILLTLTGPRNYLLTDKGSRLSSGTSISVFLRESIEPDKFTEQVNKWCRRVEFPIQLNVIGTGMTIIAERPDEFTLEMPDLSEEGAKFMVRSFPINRDGIEGELYVFAHVTKDGESWADYSWARSEYPKMVPQAVIPELPSDLTCYHGLQVRDRSWSEGNSIARLDFRKDLISPTLSRGGFRQYSQRSEYSTELTDRWEELLTEHLATTPLASSENAWIYKQKLVSRFPLLSYWNDQPGMIRIFQRNEPHCISLNDLKVAFEVTTVIERKRIRRNVFSEGSVDDMILPIVDNDFPVLTYSDLQHLSHLHRINIFADRKAQNVRWLTDECLAIDWILTQNKTSPFGKYPRNPIELVALPDVERVVYSIHKTTDSIFECLLVNLDHPFAKWLLAVYEECRQGHELSPTQFSHLWSLVQTPLTINGYKIEALNQYLNKWRNIPDLPKALCAPEVELNPESFGGYSYLRKGKHNTDQRVGDLL